ncbi:hypothetical protein [Parafrankia sp. BMG5.11]|uniref:hypothetical protein n=1 Tax=Parafrankia sp. BMG5.11 TaxID=222540 RepID=UPI001039CE38|nr:hypothetical protein [Parafrankia sp. BMG5.11]TCJ38827.1 hypothetical protein E0504_10940 [Parafrankia sp. BMG5.11]
MATEVLDSYHLHGIAEYTATASMHFLAECLGADDNDAHREQVLRAAEQPLLRHLQAGRLASWGREQAESNEWKELGPLDWDGAEVVFNTRFCNLAVEGWRGREEGSLGAILSGEAPIVRYYDIRVGRDDMVALFGRDARAVVSSDAERLIAEAPRLTGRWTSMVPSSQAKLAYDFFGRARRHLAGGSEVLNQAQLWSRYVSWLQKNYPNARPFVRSAFKEQLDRYEDGWRVRADGKGLTHSPD